MLVVWDQGNSNEKNYLGNLWVIQYEYFAGVYIINIPTLKDAWISRCQLTKSEKAYPSWLFIRGIFFKVVFRKKNWREISPPRPTCHFRGKLLGGLRIRPFWWDLKWCSPMRNHLFPPKNGRNLCKGKTSFALYWKCPGWLNPDGLTRSLLLDNKPNHTSLDIVKFPIKIFHHFDVSFPNFP